METSLCCRYLTQNLAVLHKSWKSYISEKDFGRPHDRRLHLGLTPVPFTGDAENAKIILLLLNPGLEPADYYGEFEVAGFRERLIDNLHQDFSRRDYPFVYLDPEIAWHSGYRWWYGKFQGIIAEFAAFKGISYSEARWALARAVACVEMVPYHSVAFGISEKIWKSLPSVRLARSYVREVLVPRARGRRILIVATRQVAGWDVAKSDNVILYEGPETRAAHLTPRSRGGRSILEFLGVPVST